MRVVLVPDTALVTLQEGNKWWDVSEADLHVAIGIRFRREGTGLQGRNEWRDVSEANSSAHVDIALNHVTCLLYTSPSPRDKRQSRMPSSA